MKILPPPHIFLFTVVWLILSGCQQAGIQTGTGKAMMTGSAGGQTSVDANQGLIRCPDTLGTLAVDDSRFMGQTNVTTIEPLIRLAVQQSNCFVITAIGNRRTTDVVDRITYRQRHSGDYRPGSKQHKGQKVAADYLLDPQIIVDNETSGGQSGDAGVAIGNTLGRVFGVPLGFHWGCFISLYGRENDYSDLNFN